MHAWEKLETQVDSQPCDFGIAGLRPSDVGCAPALVVTRGGFGRHLLVRSSPPALFLLTFLRSQSGLFFLPPSGVPPSTLARSSRNSCHAMTGASCIGLLVISCRAMEFLRQGDDLEFEVTSKFAVEALQLLSRGRSTLVQLPSCYVNLRHVSCSPSDVNKLCNDRNHYSLEFARWKNGGGLFHQSSDIDPTAIIEIGAVVHANCMLASDVHIRSGTVVGSSVSIGQSTKVGYNSVLSNCSVGNFSTIHNGVCVGQDGFGFFVDEAGHMVKKPQELFVRIADHVEIGANTCIDRGSWRDTVIGDHTKIDNLVQIGHNVVIGKCCMLCGQVGIAGSVTIGDYVTLGGRVAIRDHVTIASKVRLAANSSVTKDITEPGDYGGFPAVRINKHVPIRDWRKQFARLRSLLRE